jgi:ferredoxin-thioredoxin reductase catalytic subunit
MEKNNELQELRERVEAFCNTTGYRLSPQADDIINDIIQLKRISGDYYCPCQTQRNAETVCVCQPVRQGLVEAMGACFCGLILLGKG